ncbi:hypothetical protein QN277_007277 [Acacia crassicarpa]|uniref:Uncharacterized protein n=1 Tax=Acacia crassicarpa TaxID=499986 RepID=A0AAE1M8N7_9FABA|nr:hypothetical protein QN277_007277 [Acacia crassicarpa]
MATPRLFIFSILAALLFVITLQQRLPLEPEDAISSLRIELEQLKTKVLILESAIEKSDTKLKSEDVGIKQMESIILEKSQSIATLKNKIEALQQNGSLDAEQELNGSNSHGAELQNVSNEQKIEIHMTEEAPQVTEEEMMKAQPAATFIKSLKEWIPVMKDQWLPFISSLTSHFELLTAKIIEAYHVTENLLLSNKAKIQATIALFIQELPVMKDQWLTFIYSLRSCFEFTISYHNQVQQWLKTNESTRSLASIELAWFVATSLLCLPVVCLCRFCSAIFGKRGRKLGCTCHHCNIRRKLKRHLE